MFSSIPDGIQRLLDMLPDNSGEVLLFFGGLLLVATMAEKLLPRQRYRKRTHAQFRPAPQPARAPARPESTLGEFSPGSFKPYAVLNNAERALHREIESLLPQIFPDRFRLLSQVSMAEFLYAEDQDDRYSILAKRVDYLIVDAGFQPVCVIEYQGEGHSGADADAARDARRRDWQKRRALRLGNIPLVEIPARWDRRMVAERLGDVTGRRPQNNADSRPDLPASA